MSEKVERWLQRAVEEAPFGDARDALSVSTSPSAIIFQGASLELPFPAPTPDALASAHRAGKHSEWWQRLSAPKRGGSRKERRSESGGGGGSKARRNAVAARESMRVAQELAATKAELAAAKSDFQRKWRERVRKSEAEHERERARAQVHEKDRGADREQESEKDRELDLRDLRGDQLARFSLLRPRLGLSPSGLQLGASGRAGQQAVRVEDMYIESLEGLLQEEREGRERERMAKERQIEEERDAQQREKIHWERVRKLEEVEAQERECLREREREEWEKERRQSAASAAAAAQENSLLQRKLLEAEARIIRAETEVERQRGVLITLTERHRQQRQLQLDRAKAREELALSDHTEQVGALPALEEEEVAGGTLLFWGGRWWREWRESRIMAKAAKIRRQCLKRMAWRRFRSRMHLKPLRRRRRDMSIRWIACIHSMGMLRKAWRAWQAEWVKIRHVREWVKQGARLSRRWGASMATQTLVKWKGYQIRQRLLDDLAARISFVSLSSRFRCWAVAAARRKVCNHIFVHLTIRFQKRRLVDLWRTWLSHHHYEVAQQRQAKEEQSAQQLQALAAQVEEEMMAAAVAAEAEAADAASAALAAAAAADSWRTKRAQDEVDSYVQVSLAAFRLVDLSSRLESTLAEVEGAVRRQCANLDAMQREHASACSALRHWQEHAQIVASVFFAQRPPSCPRGAEARATSALMGSEVPQVKAAASMCGIGMTVSQQGCEGPVTVSMISSGGSLDREIRRHRESGRGRVYTVDSAPAIPSIGDQILAVDGKAILDVAHARELCLGLAGTFVTLLCRNAANQQLFSTTLTRRPKDAVEIV